MKARSTGTLRRLRSLLVHQVRSSRFFPTTIPDRLGDDDALAGGRLDERVIVYFPDTAESLYQLQPWLPALEALHQRFPVVVICQDSRTAAAIRRTSRLRVLTVARYGRLDDLLSRSEVAVVLYVNHSSRNFECLRFTEVVHVYLGHGDSDKGVSASNQVKAYDYCFVAGEVAVARIAAHVRRFDAALRCLRIGQPQLDGTGLLPTKPPTAAPADPPIRARVLYAPTWEGAQPSVAYSSLLTHGPQLVSSLIAAGFEVTFRPHPLSGVTSGEYAAADATIRSLVSAAGAPHRVDAAGSLATSFQDADLLVTDISAVALNWLPGGRPLVITQAAGDAKETRSPLTDIVPRLAVSDLDRCAEIVRAALADRERAARLDTIEQFFEVATDGAATAAFIAAVQRVAAEA